jgi:Ca2+-binding EF-hand superfamily protein
LKQVTAAVEMFNKMDPLDSGVCDLDALEDVLIDEFPNDNVYLIIKTMPKDMTGKLYNDDHITMKEFINWYARLTNEKIFLMYVLQHSTRSLLFF